MRFLFLSRASGSAFGSGVLGKMFESGDIKSIAKIIKKNGKSKEKNALTFFPTNHMRDTKIAVSPTTISP